MEIPDNYYQAKRIQFDLENKLEDININIGANQESLNEFLRLYRIADEYGDLDDEIKSRAEFNKRWNKFMNDFVNGLFADFEPFPKV